MIIDLSEISQICNDFIEVYRRLLAAQNIDATGNLSDSAKATVRFDNDELSVQFDLASYWKYIEYGTKPHFPPLEPIEQWINIKHILPRPFNGKLPTTHQLAYLIARKISKTGTTAKYPLRNAIEKTRFDSTLKEKLAEAIIKNGIEELKQTLSK